MYLNLYKYFIKYRNILGFYFPTITKNNTHEIVREEESEKKEG